MKKNGQAGTKVQANSLTKKNSRAGAKVKANGYTGGTSFDLHALLHGLQAMSDGEFSVRLPGHWTGLAGKIADTFNEIVAANHKMAQELKRVGQVVGKEGKLGSARSLTGQRGHGARWKSQSTRSSMTCSGRRPKSPVPSRPWRRGT